MRKGAAVGFVVAPRVDAVLAQCDESALPPPPGRKPRTPGCFWGCVLPGLTSRPALC